MKSEHKNSFYSDGTLELSAKYVSEKQIHIPHVLFLIKMSHRPRHEKEEIVFVTIAQELLFPLHVAASR